MVRHTIKMKKRKIWLAIEGTKIHASWYSECVQPFTKWKKVCKSLFPKAKICWHYIYIFNYGNNK